MRTTPSTAIERATTLVVACGSLCLLIADDGAAQTLPTASSATGSIVRSAAPQPADRHAESMTVTVVCETPEGKPIAGANVSCFEIETWTGRSRVKAALKTDVAAKAVGRASEIRTLNVGGFPALQHI